MENNEFKIDPSLLLDGTEKVGDTIWTLKDGYTKILSTGCSLPYPIETERGCYRKDGFDELGDLVPSAFKRNPFVSQYPKLMEVADNVDDWLNEPREVLFYKDERYWVFYKAINNEDWNIIGYKFAREIQPKAVEFSEEQIKWLEKRGINVEQLKIKK